MTAPAQAERQPTILAEIAVLSGVLLDNAKLDVVAQIVEAADFGERSHGLIYTAARRLADAGLPIDVVSLATELEAHGHLADVGGVEYLAGVGRHVATAVNLEHHARLVRDASRVRRLARIGEEMAARARCAALDDADEVIAWAQERIRTAFAGREVRQAATLRELQRTVYEQMQAQYEHPVESVGVPFGFADVDALTDGMWSGCVTLLGGRPKMGKTAFALNALCRTAKRGAGALYCPTEVPQLHVAMRITAQLGQVDVRPAMRGRPTDGDPARILQALVLGREFGDRVVIAPVRAATVEDIRADIRNYRRRPGIAPLRLVVVDHLHQMRAPNPRSPREQQIAALSAGLLELAQQEDVAVLLLCQLSRACEARPNKRPEPRDLRDSGALEQDANAITFIYRDEVYNPETPDRGIAEIIVGAQRNGPTGTAWLRYAEAWGRFDDLAREDR